MTTIKVTKYNGNIKVYSGYIDGSIFVMVGGIILGDDDARKLYKKLTAPKLLTAPKFRYDWMKYSIGEIIQDSHGNVFKIDNVAGNMVYLISANPLTTHTMTGGKYRVMDCSALVAGLSDIGGWDWAPRDVDYDFTIPVDSRENRI